MIFGSFFHKHRDDADVAWPVTSQMPLTDTSPDAEQDTDLDPYDNEYWKGNGSYEPDFGREPTSPLRTCTQ